MAVRGIEAIKLYIPPSRESIDTNIKEEKVTIVNSSNNTTENAMTSVQRYKQEWVQLLGELSTNPDCIRNVAFNGDLKISKFRSIYWALLLRVLSANSDDWQTQREQQRNRYEKLQLEFIKNPHDIDVPDDDPLSQSTQSVWNQYFSDQELFAVIRQDVIRTFPGVDFFRKPIIQSAMVNILFYYAREHPYMCYRQGMHEILAPILFVIYADHQSFLHFKEIAKSEIDATLANVLNPEYLEADSYSIFSRLMSSIESYYRICNLEQGPLDYFRTQSEKNSPPSTEIEVIGQLNFIRDKILAKEDLHLHNYLIKLDIPLHIFGIRWLRLLFGREFPLLDLLVLWDAIFADSDHFSLPNYILVAMLVHIRDRLLLSDYTTCLTYLMRYPTNVDINLILRHALHMLMPKRFDRPPNAFVYFTMSPEEKQRKSNGNSKQTTTAARNFVSESTKMESQIARMQAQNAADSTNMARLKPTAESDRTILEGYSTNSPELKRLELRNAQTVISIARTKLENYVAIVRKHLGKMHSEELAQALDGMEELCSLLDVKFIFPLHARTKPIDEALEAHEQQRRNDATPHSSRNSHSRAEHMSREPVSPVAVINRPPASNQQHHNASPHTMYERPDNGFMFVSTRMLGTLRDIELMPITADEKVDEHSSAHLQRQNSLPSADPLTLSPSMDKPTGPMSGSTQRLTQ